jgi:hypothetical protein
MQNLIQVQSLNMQGGGLQLVGGNGAMGLNMGVLIDNRFAGNQMQQQMD